MIIAVDGPAASGKGTIAKALAAHFDLPFMDTGLLYRAVGVSVMQAGGDPASPADALAACAFDEALLDDPALRSAEAGSAASQVSAHPAVRAALLERQRDFANQPAGAILDGRDIGTVIAPHADAKLYVTASPRIRAERRIRELVRNPDEAAIAGLQRELEARDHRDTTRADAPLRAAADALLLDTSDLTIAAAVQAAISAVEAHLRQS